MELPHILVIILLFLTLVPNVISKINAYSDPQISLWTLTVRHHSISVSDNGTLSSSPTMPTLYSIFRSELYIDEDELYSQPEFSLVGIASGFRICMDRNGYVYTKKVTKKEKKWLRRNINRQNKAEQPTSTVRSTSLDDVDDNEDDDEEDGEASTTTSNNVQTPTTKSGIDDSEPQIPSAECRFKAYVLDPANSYNHKTAIYSVIPYNSTRRTSSRRKSKSNAPIGNFLAFLRNGDPRRFRRPLDNVRIHGSISIQFEPLKQPLSSTISTRSNSPANNNKNTNTNVNSLDQRIGQMLSQTTFKSCNGRRGRKLFNIKVRSCVKHSTKSLNISRLNYVNLFKIIQKCICSLGKICRKNECVRIKTDKSKNKETGTLSRASTDRTTTTTATTPNNNHNYQNDHQVKIKVQTTTANPLAKSRRRVLISSTQIPFYPYYL